MLASGFGAVNMEMTTMGQVPATQAQLGGNPASEDTFSSLPLPLQFSSPGSQMSAPRFGSVNLWMTAMGQVLVIQTQVVTNSASVYVDTYLYQYCPHTAAPQARW